jgi:hypothetical protein
MEFSFFSLSTNSECCTPSSEPFRIYRFCKNRDRSVCIERGYRLDGTGLIPGSVRFFSSPTASRPALGPTQLTVQWVSVVKRQRREADHSPPSDTEVKNGGVIPPLPPVS